MRRDCQWRWVCQGIVLNNQAVKSVKLNCLVGRSRLNESVPNNVTICEGLARLDWTAILCREAVDIDWCTCSDENISLYRPSTATEQRIVDDTPVAESI